jgi:hypothetical protein
MALGVLVDLEQTGRGVWAAPVGKGLSKRLLVPAPPGGLGAVAVNCLLAIDGGDEQLNVAVGGVAQLKREYLDIGHRVVV